MGVRGELLVEVGFATSSAARRVKKYLPPNARVALVEDVPEADRDAYRIIEMLDYARVQSIGATTLRCTFDLGGSHDFDESVADLFDVLRSLAATSLIGVLGSDDERYPYLGISEARTAALLVDAKTHPALNAHSATDEDALALVKDLLARGMPPLTKLARADAPQVPPTAMLVVVR